MSGEPPKRRKYSLFPKTLNDCVEPLTRPVLKAQGIASSRLILDWERVVGKELAGICMPQKLSFPQGKTTDGNLTLGVQNGFAPEIQHRQHIIMEKLAGYFGYKAVSRITIVPTAQPVTPREKMAKPKKAVLPKESASLAENVEDAELKAALASFAKTLSS